MLKRVAIMLFCLMMVFIATFGFVVGVVAVPTIYSYASVNDDPIYVPLRDPSDLVIGFQSYCKSRDLTIEGSLADAVTTFTTGAFNSACNELGINISQLQAEIKAEYDQSGKPVKFLLNDTGVMAMNRIFAQFLQDNELEVGDSVNEEVYNGKYSNGSFYWVISYNGTRNYWDSASCTVSEKGTPYILTSRSVYNDFYNMSISSKQYTIPLPNSESYSLTVNCTKDSNTKIRLLYGSGSNTPYNYFYRNTRVNGYENASNYGDLYLVYNSYNDTYSLCIINYDVSSPNNYLFEKRVTFNVGQNVVNNVNITITSNNTVINNNNYEGDTIINNEGDVIVEPDPVPPGGTDPGWDIGGGGGTVTDGDGNTWNIQFPDFELPDINIDWSINGLGEKFPFSIPFDLVALVTVLNAEPQAPRFEGTVNFGFTTWNYDINLQQFDSVAQACRIAELLLLVVGLILVTRSIIKG